MKDSARSRERLNALRERADQSLQIGRAIFIERFTALKNILNRKIGQLDYSGQVLSDFIPAIRSLLKRIPEKSLINEILLFQLCFAFLICGLAMIGLWLTATWAIEDNLKQWGERWATELEELAPPLYSEASGESFIRIENYIDSFPEISLVRFYTPDGRIIFSDGTIAENKIAALDQIHLNELSNVHGSDQLTVTESSSNEFELLHISKPIWTQAYTEDGLLGLNLDAQQDVDVRLLGYVELGLNFNVYTAQLTRNILIGGLLFLTILTLLTFASATFIRRALKPLSRLQEPLRDLADGKTDFSIVTSGHRELIAITDALNTTVSSLHERDKKLWQLANHDSLTGLINRHKFSEVLVGEIRRVKRQGAESALLFVDLDQFKYINDTLGHRAGDRLLQRTAGILQNGIRRDDVVSRFGGDEFTILLSDVNESEAQAICASLLQDMQEHHFHDAGQTFLIRCSIGIAMIDPTIDDPSEILARADLACHEAKNRGRNRVEIYKASGDELEQMTADMGWSQKIQEALNNDLFIMHYQPIVDTTSRKPTHYEVLLRMRADNGQLVPPAAFLPAASRFGMMTAVDQWVIRNATQELARYKDDDQDLTLTVNISGNIFEDSDLIGCIEENLAKNKLAPESLVLEITEQVAVRNITTAADQIAEISRLGCRFAIDDFGAGYSSYTYLKSLPVHYIKIDGSFIKTLANDLVDQTIVSSISQIARATNKKTIAEHVPDLETFELLCELGIDFAQGNFIGKPLAHPECLPMVAPIASRSKKTPEKKTRRKTAKKVS